eukprot:superscaffoldBa00000077_g1172
MAPTLPSLRSEVFKPCVEDKDLAFCLNEGECSIIETVAGVHRHCRCKEGYHGLRCDQFVPKTDAILSDPKSGDTYQRQVLSIFSIASGICLLGVACMALYRRNKRHREKLQAHFSDGRSLRDCSINASGLMSKSAPRPQYSLQLQKASGNVAPGASTVAPPILSRALSKGKRFRCDSASGRVGTLLSRTSLSHFAARKGWTEVPCTRLDKGTTFLPPSLRTRSVPIIPSLQACDREAGHADTSDRNQGGLLKWHPMLAGKTAVPISNPPSTPRETVVLAPGVMPSSVSPPATTAAPSSTQTPSSIEITVELTPELKQKSLSNPMKMSGSHSEIHCGGTNTLEAGTVLESEGKSVQYSARVLHTGSGTRGLKAAGQREAQGPSQGQTSLVYGRANISLATKGPSCRGTGNAYARPSAS